MSNPYEWFYHKPKISPVVLKLKNLKKILSEKEHCQKAFKNSTDKASEVSTGGILN